MMKRLTLAVVVLTSGFAFAEPPNELNTCAAWLSTYQQFHPDDKDTSILLSDYEGELKRLDLYSVDQVENALDLPVMMSAADSSQDTVTELSRCREIALRFTKGQ